MAIGKKIIIAIDGFSSSGKSTMAKELAKKIGYLYVDSGAMYRAVTLYAIRHNLIDDEGNIDLENLEKALPSIDIAFHIDPESSKTHTFLKGEDVENEIRTMEVSNKVSPISTVASVRNRITNMLQAMGENKGIVMDGRDIGTTVFPNAEMKVFVTASPEVRAERRYFELKNKGQNPSLEEVLKNITERDYIDQNRKESPLRKADDAITLDNDKFTKDQQLDWLLAHYHRIVLG